MKFYLPDFYYKYNLNTIIIDLLKKHPEYFYDNIEIGAIYGCFPGMIWNGGRLYTGFADYDNIKDTIEAFNNRNIPIRFTCTNSLLEEKHNYDTYCNLVMDLANNGMNEILVNSPILEDYLRKTYPNYKYILSTTRCERDINKINQYTNEYHLVVTDYRDNDNFEFLEKIEKKDKIELLINAYCNPNCKIRKKHYETISDAQLKSKLKYDSLSCENMDISFYNILNNNTVIKRDDLYGKYINMGFEHFKIEGRSIHNIEVIESYMYYLIKPEYRDIVRHGIIKMIWN